MTPQEKGTTKAAALPYQLRANAHLTGKRIAIKMSAGSYVFAEKSASAPYSLYAPSNFTDNTGTERCRNWWFAVKPADGISDEWPLAAFDEVLYQLHLHGHLETRIESQPILIWLW